MPRETRIPVPTDKESSRASKEILRKEQIEKELKYYRPLQEYITSNGFDKQVCVSNPPQKNIYFEKIEIEDTLQMKSRLALEAKGNGKPRNVPIRADKAYLDIAERNAKPPCEKYNLPVACSMEIGWYYKEAKPISKSCPLWNKPIKSNKSFN